MINNGLFIMTSQELTKKDVLDRVIRNELSQINAAKLLHISDRQVRLLLKNYKKIWAKWLNF